MQRKGITNGLGFLSDGICSLDDATFEDRMTPETLGILGNDLDVDKPTIMAHIIAYTILGALLLDVTVCTTMIMAASLSAALTVR